MLNLPGVKSAEEENDQTHDALSIPPLHSSRGAVTGGGGGADVCHQTQQAGVTLPI